MLQRHLSIATSSLVTMFIPCGKEAPPAAPSAPGPTDPTAAPPAAPAPTTPDPIGLGQPKEDEIIWDGGALTVDAVKITLLHALGTEGQPKPIDVWVYEARTRRWVRVVKALAYGAIASFNAPNDFSNAYVYLLTPDEKPSDRMALVRRRVDARIADEGPNRPGPYTIIAADERGMLAFQSYNNAELRAANTSPGKARLQLHTIQAGDLGLGSMELGTAERTCFDQNLVINKGMLEVAPGALTPALYSSESDSGCKGPKLAAGETLTLADGDIAMAVTIGETAKELQLEAFVLAR